MKIKVSNFFEKCKVFADKKGVTLSPKVYFIDAMSSMALGLFASLLMGTIFGTLAKYIPFSPFADMSSFASNATGAVLGLSIAYALKAPPLVLFSAGAVGLCANNLGTVIDDPAKVWTAGPLGVFICAILAVEIGKLVSKETKIDILVTPLVTIGVGVLLAEGICRPIAYLLYYLGEFIKISTETHPFFMGIILAVVVGVILTLPISSAAICAMIGITGIAGGAAVAGCCAQMVGFAVISFRENKWEGLVAQGLGTSMLQMGNIEKNPKIWLAPTLAAAVVGPVSTCLFGLTCSGVSAGMGTCGLVGPLAVLSEADFSVTAVFGVLTVCLFLPAVLSLAFDLLFRKLGWVKDGDMKLSL